MARRRGNKWQADVVIDGKRRRPSFATEAEALAYEAMVANGMRGNPVVTLRSFVDDNFDIIWGENRRQDFTRVQLRAIYAIIPETTLITNITTSVVDEAIAKWKQQGLAGQTINHRLSVLSKLLKRARRKEIIETLPYIERQRVGKARERVWDHHDERKAFLYLEHMGLEAARWIVQFLLYTGGRKGECWQLRRNDVKDGWVRFSRDTTKNGMTRMVPLVPKAKEAWDALCRMSNHECPFAVLPMDTFRFQWERLRGHFDALDDPEFVPHMLRHTCATRLVAAGVGLPQVMKWMGHKSIQVTMRYAHVAPKDLDVAAAALA